MQKVTNFLNVAKKDNEVTLSIIGDIGYNWWADTFEDYKKNTSENMAKELNAIKELKADVINVELESLGGDLSHALSIYSLLKNSGSKVKVFLRGANASSSTIIASSASSASDVYMDNTGLYLVHKPMSNYYGNVNELEQGINDLKKWQLAAEQCYLNLGVEQEVLNDLMERNNGNGEWLTFSEAKEYGFVGNEWNVGKVRNYNPNDFKNKGFIEPKNINNLITNKKTEMENTEKQSLFQEFKNWFKNEAESEIKAAESEDLKTENETLKTENEALKAEIETLKAELEAMKPAETENNIETLIENKVKEAIKNTIEPIKASVEEKKVSNENDPFWKKHLSFKNN